MANKNTLLEICIVILLQSKEVICIVISRVFIVLNSLQITVLLIILEIIKIDEKTLYGQCFLNVQKFFVLTINLFLL